MSSHSRLSPISNGSPSSCRDDCFFTNNSVTLSSSANFASCAWSKCEADYGGAIFLNVSNSAISLTVSKGEFYSCISSYRGGGIYVEGIGDINITNTIFHQCIAQAAENYGGGGIEIDSEKKIPRIDNTDFILCKSGNDAGGVGIWKSPLTFQETCILSCRFVQCEINHTLNSDGGSLLLWYSKAAIGCSNTLFTDSYSELRGGAASYNISGNHNSSIPLFIFCFFKNNSAQSNPGNDIYFEGWIPDSPFLNCFSVTKTNRVYFNGVHDNWLPQDNMCAKPKVAESLAK